MRGLEKEKWGSMNLKQTMHSGSLRRSEARADRKAMGNLGAYLRPVPAGKTKEFYLENFRDGAIDALTG